MTSPSPRGQYHQSLIDKHRAIRARLVGRVTPKSFRASIPALEKTRAELEEERALDDVLPLVRRDFIDVGSSNVPIFDNKRPSAYAIMEGVAGRHGVTVAMIRGARRTGQIVDARWEAIHVVSELYPDWSITRIGKAFKRDHTTILHALRKYRERVGQ